MPPTDTEYAEVTSSEDEFIILQSLLDAPDVFVSGSRLAEQLAEAVSAEVGSTG